MYGFIVAIDEEIHFLLELTTIIEKIHDNHLIFYRLKLRNGSEVIVTKSGAGKVNAALAAIALINKFSVKAIINTGIAGGLEKTEPNFFVIAEKVIYHDVDMSSYRNKYELGQIRGLPQFYITDTKLHEKVKKILISLKFPFITGTIATGDIFVKNTDKMTAFIDNYDNILAFDMESAAIGQICFLYKVPFLSFRCISDIINGKIDKKSFNFDILKACKNLASVLNQF